MNINGLYNIADKSNKEYKYVVSLGHACAVAHELEHLGLRHHSGPFDWQASRSLAPKIELLNDNFKTFFDNMTVDTLYQRAVRNCYYMPACDIYFIHDFNQYEPLSDQLDSVIKKYRKRVTSLLEDIKAPTLFIYYLFDQVDADYIDGNLGYIRNTLKSFNNQNEIVFIADPSVSMKTQCFYVENDKGSDIAYDFTKRSKEIKLYFRNIPYSKCSKIKNLLFFYKNKIKKRLKRKNLISNNQELLKQKNIYYHHLEKLDD